MCAPRVRRSVSTWSDRAGRALRIALAFVLPDSCISCGRALPADRRHLCATCRGELRPAVRWLDLPALARGPADGPGRDDPAADASRVPTRAVYALEFEGAARDLVHALKYGSRPSAARELAGLMCPVLRMAVRTPPDLIVPVPLHATRLRERGFNQSGLIARALSAELGLSTGEALTRTRHTAPQAGLGREARLLGPCGAFRARPELCEGRRVLLLDDVVTTGATLAASAEALMNAGAVSVACAAAAGVSERPVACATAGVSERPVVCAAAGVSERPVACAAAGVSERQEAPRRTRVSMPPRAPGGPETG